MDETGKRYTRRQAAEFLTKNGYPIAFGTFERMSMPSRGQGPKVDGVFNGRFLYRAEDLLGWAKSRSQPGNPS